MMGSSPKQPLQFFLWMTRLSETFMRELCDTLVNTPGRQTMLMVAFHFMWKRRDR